MSWSSPTANLIFGEDFDRPKPEAPPPPDPRPAEPIYSAMDLQMVRAEALREGHAAGLAEADGVTAALARHALLTIAERLDAARDEAAAIAEDAAEATARLLMDAFATAFPALCARHGERELRAIVRSVLPRLQREPAITVRASPHVTQALTDEIASINPELLDRVRVIPTDAVPPGDLRIAWRAGGVRRDNATLWTDIENVLAPAGLLTRPGLANETATRAVRPTNALEIENVE
jgi:flagellar biosynthesis/type III secretory pathway protein FliH